MSKCLSDLAEEHLVPSAAKSDCGIPERIEGGAQRVLLAS